MFFRLKFSEDEPKFWYIGKTGTGTWWILFSSEAHPHITDTQETVGDVVLIQMYFQMNFISNVFTSTPVWRYIDQTQETLDDGAPIQMTWEVNPSVHPLSRKSNKYQPSGILPDKTGLRLLRNQSSMLKWTYCCSWWWMMMALAVEYDQSWWWW